MGIITDNEIAKLRYDLDDGKPVDELAVRALLSAHAALVAAARRYLADSDHAIRDDRDTWDSFDALTALVGEDAPST